MGVKEVGTRFARLLPVVELGWGDDEIEDHVLEIAAVVVDVARKLEKRAGRKIKGNPCRSLS